MKKPDRIQQKRARKKEQAFNLREKLLPWWKSKNPVLRFALGFALLMGIFYGFWVTKTFTDNILDPIVQFDAQLASRMLRIFGYHPSVVDSTLSSPGIAIDVGRGCDALEPIAIFLFAVVLFPTSIRSKLIGLSVGIPILFVLNQIRIITLYMAGVYNFSVFGKDHEWVFNLIHLQIWPVLFIIATLVLLAYWILYSLKQKKSEKSQ